MEIAVDTSLSPVAGSNVHVCFRPNIDGGTYTLAVGRFKVLDTDEYIIGNVFGVPGLPVGNIEGQCTNKTYHDLD